MAMSESDPFRDAGRQPELQCTTVSLRGPNVTNSIDRPPRPDALRAQRAAIRKHLGQRRRGEGRPDAA
ncbi:MAG TPA: hypothetical protein VMS02_02275 [Solirubrobacteraceae bacterium]|nr:hypothetical protein [Solirubrobacteraceae bacterium]